MPVGGRFNEGIVYRGCGRAKGRFWGENGSVSNDYSGSTGINQEGQRTHGPENSQSSLDTTQCRGVARTRQPSRAVLREGWKCKGQDTTLPGMHDNNTYPLSTEELEKLSLDRVHRSLCSGESRKCEAQGEPQRFEHTRWAGRGPPNDQGTDCQCHQGKHTFGTWTKYFWFIPSVVQ